MGQVWEIDRLAGISLAPRVGTYEAVPADVREEAYKITHPHLFKFEAVSIGDDFGQMCFVPLDESSEETANFIIEAVKFYVKHLEEK